MKLSKFLLTVSLFTIASCSSDDDKDVTCQQQIGETNGYQYVDLGLSVKWATCNVGATSPHETGNLYAWGGSVTQRRIPINQLQILDECKDYHQILYGQ